ncbi:MAG: YdcF family protein [Actinobacteria bacterium]|nr:YdcF family protein [Actinomycetota bacterium]
MSETVPPAVPDSIAGELQVLVRVYRAEQVFSEDVALEGTGTAAVVLGAQVLRGGRPSGTLRARTLHAARLYAAGGARLVIPTGGVGKYPPSEAEVMARILREAGVPDEVVLPEERAKSTRESAQLVAGLARARGIDDLTVITDPLHCVRAVEAFRAEGFEVRVSAVYSSPMWRIQGLRQGQFLREIGAILWYRARRGRAERRAG